MKINDYIKEFYENNDDIRPLPWIICKDGFRMSVQVGRGMNRKHGGMDKEGRNNGND